MRELSPLTIERLRRFDTPTIANAIELFDLRPRHTGYMDARIRALFPELPPVVGCASTARLHCAFPRRESGAYRGLEEQIRRFEELPGPAVVVLQDLDDPPVAATFGEVMCTSYQAFGAVGIITSGAARDIEQVRRLRFPAFASGVICAHGYAHFVSIHEPVRVGGLIVHPGDWLHADGNGAINIPAEIADELVDVAAEYAAAEAVVLEYLRQGKPDPAGYCEARREMLRRIEELGRRVRRPPAAPVG
ncbi:MAG: RraA family protein [Bryobacterales bacterium]|nr:RraA family protein [Bryobacteraceae bacterium]MDW8129700.1 RraA family protein [Bryobacterales bacterium]